MNAPLPSIVPADLVSTYRGRSVAIFGASGFIGRWVAKWLVDSGARVHLLVRDPQAAAPDLASIGVRGPIFRWTADRPAEIPGILRQIRPDVIFNLAGYGVRRDERDAGLAQSVNCDAVTAIATAQAAIPSDWEGLRLVHVGSALEYGQADGNLDELQTAPLPTTIYGMSKLAGTTALTHFCEDYGFRGVTARLFTVYGPGEGAGRLLPSLIAASSSQESIRLTAGEQRRDFTFVDDVAEGLLRLGCCKSLMDHVMNLATGRLTPVREFIETAAELLNIAPQRLMFGALPTRPEEMQHDAVRTERLRRNINWQPTTSIRQGISRTLQYQHAANVM